MDELSPLFQEIEFHERFRGYDPDEVDAYVDRVARAAAELRGRLAALQERVEAAESRGGATTTSSSEAEETLTRTLVLAQRTADAAISEARVEAERTTNDAATSAQAILSAAESEAQVTLREAQAEASATLREAEDRAALVLAEAETDRRTMVSEAESVAADAASAERGRLASEVSELQDYRAFLADDIEILERHLTEERHQLTASLSALTDLLESPDAFRAGRLPQLSDVEFPEELIEVVAAAAEDFEPAPEPLPEVEPVLEVEAESPPVLESEPEPTFDVEPEPLPHTILLDEVEPSDPIESVAAIEAPWAPASKIEPVAAPSFSPQPEPDMIDLVDPSPTLPEPSRIESSLIEPSLIAPARTDDVSMESVEEVLYANYSDVVTEAPPRLVTAADLETETPSEPEVTFETVDMVDPGPVTAQIPAIEAASLFAEPTPATESDDDPFLTQLRDAMDGQPIVESDDEALSAFFDQEDDENGRSWFGRRR